MGASACQRTDTKRIIIAPPKIQPWDPGQHPGHRQASIPVRHPRHDPEVILGPSPRPGPVRGQRIATLGQTTRRAPARQPVRCWRDKGCVAKMDATGNIWTRGWVWYFMEYEPRPEEGAHSLIYSAQVLSPNSKLKALALFCAVGDHPVLGVCSGG